MSLISVFFVPTKGTDDEDAIEFAYVAYACVASENQAQGVNERIRLTLQRPM